MTLGHVVKFLRNLADEIATDYRLGAPMDFTVAVGTAEKHDVHLHFNQWIGQVRIDVDGADAAGDWRMFTLHKTRRYEFPVGQEERHDVVIEKSRKGVLGGFRDQTCRVLVDGETVSTYIGSVTGRTSRV